MDFNKSQLVASPSPKLFFKVAIGGEGGKWVLHHHAGKRRPTRRPIGTPAVLGAGNKNRVCSAFPTSHPTLTPPPPQKTHLTLRSSIPCFMTPAAHGPYGNVVVRARASSRRCKHCGGGCGNRSIDSQRASRGYGITVESHTTPRAAAHKAEGAQEKT